MQAGTNTQHNESLPLALFWQHQCSTGKRWQWRKIDEPEAKGYIPLNILRKHFDSASLCSHKTPWQLIQSFYYAPTNPNDTSDTTSSHVSIQDVQSGCRACGPAVPPRHALGDTAVWGRDREEVEMSWVRVFLIDEWTWMRTGQRWPFEDS